MLAHTADQFIKTMDAVAEVLTTILDEKKAYNPRILRPSVYNHVQFYPGQAIQKSVSWVRFSLLTEQEWDYLVLTPFGNFF